MLLISIIIPSYNRAHLIGDTLNSILDQTYKSWECIIVDDGSTDNSYDLIVDFIKKRRKKKKKIKFKIVKFKKNKGKGAALISGIKNASKDWLLTIDTDISVSLLEINNWIKYKYLKTNNKIYFGSRNLKNSIIKFEYHRKLIGFFFNANL